MATNKSASSKSVSAKSGQKAPAKSGQKAKGGQAPAATTGKKAGKVTAELRKPAAKSGQGQGQSAPAAKGKGGKPAAKPAAKSGQGQGRVSEYPTTTRVQATPDVELREGSFAAKISALAAKPITLGELIEKAVAKRSDFFRTSVAGESADAARRSITIRVRDLIRGEYLTVTK